MSDNQFEQEAYGGLEAATASAPSAEPAFGDVEGEFAAGGSGGTEIGILPPNWRRPCSTADCGNPTEHPAEDQWQRLVSAVPVQDQLYRLKPRVEGMSYPTEEDFRTAVAAVRPEHADEHSLARLSTGWTEEVGGKLGDWSERIRSNLTDLAEGWSGTDFDAFVTMANGTRELVDGILEDVDATVSQLQSTQENIYTLQGGDSGEIPYPAPQFWIEGEWHSWVAMHIRPAWWHGDCIKYTCQDAEGAVALAGVDPELATEIIDYIDDRVDHWVRYYENPANIEADGLDPKGITLEEAKEMAVADAMDNFGGVVEQNRSDYESRHQNINEEIDQRSADNDAEQQGMRTTSSDKPYPEGADESKMDLEPPSMEQPSGTASPETTQDPSLEPPTGEAPDGGDGGGDADVEDEGPGGLASGGPGGGAGGFGGSAPGGSLGSPGGTGSPAGGAGAGVGAGTGAAGIAGGAAAAGSGGRGMTGMMGGAGGAGRPMGGENTERDPDVDLNEDRNMWGFVSEDDDPYA